MNISRKRAQEILDDGYETGLQYLAKREEAYRAGLQFWSPEACEERHTLHRDPQAAKWWARGFYWAVQEAPYAPELADFEEMDRIIYGPRPPSLAPRRGR